MAEGDRIEVQFTETEALAQRLLDKLEQDIAQATAIGDQLEVARLQATKAAIGGPQQYVRQTPEIEQDTAALERENVVRQRGLEIELQTLDVLRQQVAERMALEEETAAQRIGVAAPAGTRFGMGFGGLASQQAAAEQAAALAAARQEEQRITAEMEKQAQLREESFSRAQQIGFAAGARGQRVPASQRDTITTGPMGAGAAAIGGEYTADEMALARYNVALGEYQGFATRAGQSSEFLSANLTRLGMVEAESSNAMRAHGALTTEWLSSLARGESTISEFGYQLGATVGKVAGWTAATGATFAALGAIVEFGKGAIDSANGVQQLKRTIDDLNTQKAAEQFRQLSQETDVSLKDAANAVFVFSRTFHNQDDAVNAARLGLSAYQLDNVQLADSVKMATALTQQYGLSATQLASVYDMLASSQREYNARISDMIPLLQKSSGAVKNAGGDLEQLIQLGTVATRVTQLSGTQVGTAFYRGAATFVPKDAGALATQFGLGKDINPLTGQGNFTQLLMDAIKESANLSGPQRTQLAKDIFGPQYGGRFGALFSPESAKLLDEVTGGGKKAITPDATRGSMQHELDTQLQQTRKELDQFVFGLQRLGSALAQTGALAPLGATLRLAITGLDELTSLLNVFAQLPGPVKEVVSLLVEMRLAMLFFSRTRMGSSVPLITSVPFFRPSEATIARRDLAQGTRAAMQQVEQDIAASTSQSLTMGARQVELEQQRAAMIKEAGGRAAMTTQELETYNGYSARIEQLQAEQLDLERQQAAQEAARADLAAQMVGITATTRRLRMSDEEVLALRNRTGAGTEGGVSGLILPAGMGAADEATAGAAGDTERVSALTRARMIAQMDVMEAGSAAAVTVRSAAMGLTERATGFIAALDPLTVGLLAFPFIYSAMTDGMNKVKEALQQAKDAASGPVESARDLFDHANALRSAAKQLPGEPNPNAGLGGIGNFFKMAGVGVGQVFGIHSLQHLMDPSMRAETAGQSEQLHALGDLYQAAATKFQADAQDLIKTQAGREQLYAISQQLKARMQQALSGSDFSKAEISKIYQAFAQSLQDEYGSVAASGAGGGKDPSLFTVYAGLDPTKIKQNLQALDDRSKIYGTNNSALKDAALGYAALADKYRNSTDDTTLQAMAQAQQNFINAVNKNVQDLMHSATLGTTDRSQMGSLQGAITLLQNEREQVQSAFSAAIKYAKDTHQGMQAIQRLQAAEQQMLAGLADLHKQVIEAALQLIKSESDVVTSEIQGISPESDVARAQSQVQGLEQQLAFAQSHGADAQQTNDLLTQLNNARTALLKQQIDNARNVIQATGQLNTSAVTGITPQDDILRAKSQVTAAQGLLTYDQSHGVGEHQILQDQSSLNDAVRNLNQSLQQRSQQIAQDAKAFIDAQASYEESLSTNPIQIARDQLAADIAALSTIKPQDYKTYQEYQTAILEQKAKVGTDTKNLRQQIVDTDMRTLQFELHTQKITDQQYVDGLQQLLKMKKLTLQERQDIETQIFDTLHQSAVDLNVGSIKMPTTYEIRSLIQGARSGAFGAPVGAVVTTTNHNNVTVNVKVSSAKDPHLKTVTDAVHKAITQVSGQAQAAGVI